MICSKCHCQGYYHVLHFPWQTLSKIHSPNNNSWGNIKSCLIERGSDRLGLHFRSFWLIRRENLERRRKEEKKLLRATWASQLHAELGRYQNCHNSAQREENCHLLTIKRTPRRNKEGGKESGVNELSHKQTETNRAPTLTGDTARLLSLCAYTTLWGQSFLNSALIIEH